MKCKHVCDLMPEYCSEELSLAQTANVKLHLSECESCRREMAIMSRAMNALKAPVTHFDPPNVLAAVKAQARAQKSQWQAAFANWSLATVAAGGLIAWIAIHSHSTLAPSPVAYVQLAPSIPQRIAVVPPPPKVAQAPSIPSKIERDSRQPMRVIRVCSSPSQGSRDDRRARIYRHPARRIASVRPVSRPIVAQRAPKTQLPSTDEVMPEAEHTPQVASAGHYYRSDDGSVRIEIPLPDKSERVCVATMPSTTR